MNNWFQTTTSQSNDSDDEDDRKPPARIMYVTPSPTRRSKRKNKTGQQNKTNETPSLQDSNTTTPEPPPSTPQSQITGTTRQSTAAATTTTTTTDIMVAKPPPTSRALLEELSLLFGTSTVSFLLFLYHILPFTAFCALAVWVSSLALTLYTLQQAAVRQVQHAVQTTGLGRLLLPDSWYSLLTEQSLHEMLTDPESAWVEYRYLLLYFLPLSPEQLQQYLERLAPQHIRDVQQPGIGHVWLGRNVMRMIVGEEGMATMTRRALPPPPDVEEASVISMDDMTSVESSAPPSLVPPSPGTTTSPEEAAQEEQVLIDALTQSAYTTVWQPIVGFVSYYTRFYTRAFTQRVARYGFSLSFLSTSIGLAGHYRFGNVMSLPSMQWFYPRPMMQFLANGRRSSQRDSLWWSQAVWTTAVVGGATAVTAFGFQWWFLRPPTAPSSDDTGNTKSPEKEKGK